jgi:hypothetical protein
MIRNIHIAIRKSTKSNLSLAEFPVKYKNPAEQQLQLPRACIARRVDDIISEGRD